MIKKNINSKDKVIVLVSLTLFVLIISAIVFLGYKKQKILEKDFTITEARITKVHLNARKGTTSRRNIALYTYEYMGKEYVMMTEIYNKKVSKGACYQVKVSNIEPRNK